MTSDTSRVVVVGAGFAGAVIARLLAEAGHACLVVDRRPHVAGNAYDETDAHGILVHRYGPHIFHTNSDDVVAFLSRFTAWIPYEHRVLASIDGRLFPIPINVDTVNRFFGLSLTEAEVEPFLETQRVKLGRPPENSEEVVLAGAGRALYEAFFKGYTTKQWGVEPSRLGPSVAARIPVRTNRDDRYFTDRFQAMPSEGYTPMFRRMLDHPSIEVRLGVDFFADLAGVPRRHLVYTGPVDRFFDHCYGPLPYRSLRFESEHLPDVDSHQPTGTVNYPNEHAYTRVTEFKKLTGQEALGTTVMREYPTSEGDPYYPVPSPDNDALFRRYDALCRERTDVTFVGRLAQYRYYNMDQVVAAALKTGGELASRLSSEPR